MKSQQQFKRTFSCEFFPPKTEEGSEALRKARKKLSAIAPKFFSVTFGAGGSTQQGTYDAVAEIQQSGLEAAPHLSCIASTEDQLRDILAGYRALGIRHIVALRGDMPSGTQATGSLRHANELVEFIRAETGDHFHVEVAAYPEFHPQAGSASEDLANFKRKVVAGADSAITQYFYNAEAYFRFIDDCERLNLDIPIVPGIMPITNYTSLARFSDMCGAEIPRWIRKRLQDFGDDRASIRSFGEDVVTELCARLLGEGAPGLHFYTMNRAEPTLAIWKNLGLPTD